MNSVRLGGHCSGSNSRRSASPARSAIRDGFEICFVLLADGAAEPIPDRGVSTEIAGEVPMMLIMERRGDEPLRHPCTVPPPGQELVSRMDIQAHDDAGRDEENHRRVMNREQADEEGYKTAVYQRLKRADG